jgi:hypothetical protein
MLGGCAAVPPSPAPLTGDWGGEHVELHLGGAGGTLDYDCAHGTIGPVVPNAAGRFTAAGSHTPEHGGPVREGEVLPSHAAQYSGTVHGDRMTLEGRTDDGVRLGPFALRRGAQPMLMRCL